MLPILTTCMRSLGNPGDTFIGIGGQYLIEKAFGRTINWENISKFEQEDYYRNKESILEKEKLLYWAGTPQYHNFDSWKKYIDDEFWINQIQKTGTKVISLAGGGGHPDPNLGVKRFCDWCLSNANTLRILENRKKSLVLTTVRDKHSHKMLNRVGIENYYLPCTATWASKALNIEKSTQEEILFVFPFPRLMKQENYNNLFDSMLETLKELQSNKENVRIICHDLPEYEHLLSLNIVDKSKITFTYDFLFLLNTYKKAKTVISARLHGGLPAFGIPGVKVVSIAIDMRGLATRIFDKIVTLSANKVTKNVLIDAICQAKESTQEDLVSWENKYIELLLKCKPLIENING